MCGPKFCSMRISSDVQKLVDAAAPTPTATLSAQPGDGCISSTQGGLVTLATNGSATPPPAE